MGGTFLAAAASPEPFRRGEPASLYQLKSQKGGTNSLSCAGLPVLPAWISPALGLGQAGNGDLDLIPFPEGEVWDIHIPPGARIAEWGLWAGLWGPQGREADSCRTRNTPEPRPGSGGRASAGSRDPCSARDGALVPG